MVDQILLGLQALFIVLLYLFIWRVMRTASRDLRLPQEGTLLLPAGFGGHEEARPSARLVVERSPVLEHGASFTLGTSPVTIGRSLENTIALAADNYASARHARVEPLRDGLWIMDLDSTNGTFVNGRPVSKRERLHEGDVVRVGETELRLET